MPTIKNIKLNESNAIPQLGLGTWQMIGQECTDAVKNALSIGYRHIDTAEMYGNEADIAPAIADYDREDLFITSKVWYENLAPGKVLQAAGRSLENLATDYLDLYLIHWPNSNIDIEGTLTDMKKLKNMGKIRNIGVSNFTINHLTEALKVAERLDIKIVNNQVEFHPGLYQKDLLDFCRDHGISLTGYSPLAQGQVMKDETLNKIADKHEATPAQIAIAWLLHHGIIAIPKAAGPDHAKTNWQAADITLSEEEIKEIDELGNNNRLITPDHHEFDK